MISIRQSIEELDQQEKRQQLLLERQRAESERARAILELFYATGIRCAELVGLDVDQVDMDGRMLRVLGKGRKERIVPFGMPAHAAISAYLPARGRCRPRDGVSRVMKSTTWPSSKP